MTTPSTSDLSALREVAEKATPGPWKHVTYMSGTQNVEYPGSKGITFSDQVIAADASDICYESDAQPLPFINISHRREDKGSEVDPQRSLNAAYIATFNPQTVLALLDHLAAEKARADAAEAEREDIRTQLIRMVDIAEDRLFTISTLTAEKEALIRERDEAREGWRQMQEALKPFAKVAELFSDKPPIGSDDVLHSWETINGAAEITMTMCARARSALSGAKDEREGM